MGDRKANDPKVNARAANGRTRNVPAANGRVASPSKSKKPPGGAWSEYSSRRKKGQEQQSGGEDAAAGAAHSNRNSSQASGAEGAAGGAAHSDRNSPQASGAEGAAAGAAHSNRNSPQASGAEGAAAGAAASNRNNPKASGAEGAAAGAAASNRNNPKYSGAQGAAAGAAASNRNQPQYSGRKVPLPALLQPIATSLNILVHRALPLEPLPRTAISLNTLGPKRRRGCSRCQQQQSAILGRRRCCRRLCVRSKQRRPSRHVQPTVVRRTPRRFCARRLGRRSSHGSRRIGARVATQCNYDIDATPISYNYGSNVTCVGSNVLVNGQSAGTAEEFSQQADEIAEKGTAANASPNDKWLPLGVFALVRNEQQHPQLIMQLAVNQQGILRGNYTDEVTDSTSPIHGAIDQKTQRAAWTVGNNKYSVMEAGTEQPDARRSTGVDPQKRHDATMAACAPVASKPGRRPEVVRRRIN